MSALKRASFERALAWIDGATGRLGSETIALDIAVGRVLAADVRTRAPIPAADCAAIDGFAVCAADSVGAGAYNPLAVSAVAIETGEPMPPQKDAVVPFDQAEPDGSGSATLVEPTVAGANVDRRGTVAGKGMLLTAAGTPLTSRHLGILALGGFDRVSVVHRPKVRLVIAAGMRSDQPIDDRLHGEGIAVKSLNVGSMGGLAAAKRGECDIAAIHLMDPETDEYNRPFLTSLLELVPGYRRLQGIVYRRGDPRFEGRTIDDAIAAAIAAPECIMVNRNTGSGTRILTDRLLAGAKPRGYWSQPKSHNAVAAAVAQNRADWGIAIESVARQCGLGFIPAQDERYDFVVPRSRIDCSPILRFRSLLADAEIHAALTALGFKAKIAFNANLLTDTTPIRQEFINSSSPVKKFADSLPDLRFYRFVNES